MNNLTTAQILSYLKNEHQALEYQFSMNKTPKTIMLTGANGFLSSYLIPYLCSLDEVETIYCLVRNSSNFDSSHSKVKVVPYIGSESFQLDNHSLDSLLLKTDCFIHCAAKVHNIKNIHSLYDANVELSYLILQKIKHLKLSLSFHLISTLSVFASSSNHIDNYLKDSFHQEFVKNKQINPSEDYSIIGGYAQTKWLSEYLYSKTNAHIIRLGLLTPSYDNPVFNPNEFFTMLINLINKVGIVPHETKKAFENNTKNILVDITPVDFAAKFISKLISSKYQFPYQVNNQNYISHIANHNPLSLFQMVNIIDEHNIIKLFKTRKEEWEDKISELKLGSIEKKLLTHTFFRETLLESDLKYFNIDLFQTSLYNWSYANKAGEMPTSAAIFHKYLKDYHV